MHKNPPFFSNIKMYLLFFKHLLLSLPQILMTIFTGEEIVVTLVETPKKVAKNFVRKDGSLDQEGLAEHIKKMYEK
jgi:hypothetical protein